MPDIPTEIPAARASILRDTIGRVALLLRLERKILSLIVSYALAIGIFALIVPLTVQELVNTFAYAVQPIMIVTLSGIMAMTLIFIGGLKVLQTRSLEILVQRLYTRIAVAFTQQLPRFKDETFSSRYATYFFEAEFLPRALVAFLVDFINVIVGGMIGMTLLVFYHPYFLIYNFLLLSGFVTAIVVLSQGGLRATMKVSQLHYQNANWLQDIADNMAHLKSTVSMPLLMKHTDELVQAYVKARKTRSDIIHRQYKGAMVWQALGHSGLIGIAGWLLSSGQITLGQFVASEVVVGTLLMGFDTVARRIYAFFYVFTSLSELAFMFSHPKDMETTKVSVPLPDPSLHGVRLTCHDVAFTYPNSGEPVFQEFNMEVAPGEKVAIFSESSRGKSTLARILSGLYTPTVGVVRYNGVDLRDLDMESINQCRGLVLDSQLSLFEGTLEENITLGRAGITYEDLRWSLRFVELEDEVDALRLGLKTPLRGGEKGLSTGQTLRILIARAIITRPQVLILDGSLHSMHPAVRETILRRLCSKEEPWSVLFVTNDPSLRVYVERMIALE